MIKYTVILYTLKTHRKVECVFAAGGRKISSVLTGLERPRGKASTNAVGPGFDGSESATRWKRFK